MLRRLARACTTMAADLRLIQRALRTLRATVPLKDGAAEYVERPDALGQKIIDRVAHAITHRLLLAGPTGCGKTTELLHVVRLAHPNFAVFLCPCDRDLDLYRLDRPLLARYLLWRTVFVASQPAVPFKLSPEIVREALRFVGTDDIALDNPRLFFSEVKPRHASASIYSTLQRLLAEIEAPLLLLDGLEKIQPDAAEPLREFIRSPELSSCQTVIVVPYWTLFGWSGLRTYDDVEVLEITAAVPEFVRAVLARRVGEVFTADALDLAAERSGGVVRDGLQLAGIACRRAMDERTAIVEARHVESAVEAMRDSFYSMISDDPARVATFLKGLPGRLSGDPAIRDRLLGHGIVLPSADGMFRVHPCLDVFPLWPALS